MTAYTINLNPVVEMTDEQFYGLCRANPDIKFERDTQGKLITKPARLKFIALDRR
jgi:Uma2 family endonuclease